MQGELVPQKHCTVSNVAVKWHPYIHNVAEPEYMPASFVTFFHGAAVKNLWKELTDEEQGTPF